MPPACQPLLIMLGSAGSILAVNHWLQCWVLLSYDCSLRSFGVLIRHVAAWPSVPEGGAGGGYNLLS